MYIKPVLAKIMKKDLSEDVRWHYSEIQWCLKSDLILSAENKLAIFWLNENKFIRVKKCWNKPQVKIFKK